MNKEFIPYELALELKKLGFKERCLGHYWENLFYFRTTFHHPSTMPNSPESCLAPTYSQAFRWFRENHNCHHTIKLINEKYVGIAYSSVVNFSIDEFNTYEEAELACLRKLIETVKENGN
jgi:hypothetical protein